MLQVTHDAAQLITELRRGQDVPDDHGLRVFAEASQPGEVTIALGFTDGPAEGDHVSEQEGLRVFVASELAAPLEDAAIDVADAEDGASQLIFRPQGDAEPLGG